MLKGNKNISKNTKESEKIAFNFLSKILKKEVSKKRKGALVVGLSGDLGTGKTTFVKNIAKKLGIKNKINSPTFVLIKKYHIEKMENYKNLFHLDAYRFKNENELLRLGWGEIIDNSDNMVFIEWPENVMKIMPKKHHKISIFHTKEGHRKFNIKSA